LEGKNKVFANCIQAMVGLMAGLYGMIFVLGAIEKNPAVLEFLVFFFLAVILGVIIIFGPLLIIHWLIIIPFCKNLGYISFFKGEKNIIE
jgi:hypothetical protein